MAAPQPRVQTVGRAWAAGWALAAAGMSISDVYSTPNLGGTIGGAFTLPRRSGSSPTTAVRLGLESALAWGVSFLLFQTLAFYAGYILMQMTVDPLVPIVGHQMAKVLGWAIPAGLAGLLAARLALSLQAKEAV